MLALATYYFYFFCLCAPSAILIIILTLIASLCSEIRAKESITAIILHIVMLISILIAFGVVVLFILTHT